MDSGQLGARVAHVACRSRRLVGDKGPASQKQARRSSSNSWVASAPMSDAPTPPDERSDGRAASSSAASTSSLPRRTLAVSNPQRNGSVILTAGDAGFTDEASRHYREAEGAATDGLIALKRCLRQAEGDEVWSVATRGIARLLGAQYAFVSKRLEVDDDPTASCPPLGEPGSCLMGLSVYFNDGNGSEIEQKKTKYLAYSSPCEHMKLDRVLLIPERLSEVIPNNQNELPQQPEAYLAVPLSVIDPVSGSEIFFAHFGAMWTADGLDKKTLSFAFAELLLHGISDLILDAFAERGLVYSGTPTQHMPSVAPTTGNATQSISLQPYAKNLSHELRTPMQGVVGMLDIMHGTVQEACEGQMSSTLRRVLNSLKGDIEVVQESARRAVEAADNVVLACGMNMGEPNALELAQADEEMQDDASSQLLTPRDTTPPHRGHKRLRSSEERASDQSSKTPRLTVGRRDAIRLSSSPRPGARNEGPVPEIMPSLAMAVFGQLSPGIRQANIRNIIQTVVINAVNHGGRPESAITQPTDGGEEIEIRQRSSNGEQKKKLVRWNVNADVPEIIDHDERDLYGIISRVLHNAFKFTDAGSIDLTVQLGRRGRGILITISDTGIGIPATFMPKLFRAFSKEDDGINSQREGLGLGLLVAKGMVRRLKGDLKAVRSATDGPDRGSVFEIRIPITPGDAISTPGSTLETPTPGRPRSLDTDQRSSSPTYKRAFSTPWAGTPEAALPSSTPNTEMSGQNDGGMEHDDTIVPTRPQVQPSYRSHPPACTSAPRKAAHQWCMPRALTATPLPPPPPGSLAARLPLSILVVEDNRTLRAILVRMLHGMGYRRVLQAYDGADAVRQMARHRRRRRRGLVSYDVDVVLMDLWMPGLNGYDAAERILDRAGGLGEEVDVGDNHDDDDDDSDEDGEEYGYEAEARPVILAITADVTDDALERVARAGMKGPLTKPYNRTDLERCLLNFCMPGTN